MKRDNTTEVLIKFVNELNVSISRKSIEQELRIHPESNTLLAISDCFRQWNIDTGAYKIAVEDLENIDCPFIAHMVNGFVLVTKLNEKKIIVSDEKMSSEEWDIKEFKKWYLGTVLLAEPMANAGEADYAGQRKAEISEQIRKGSVVTGLIIVVVALLLLNSSYLINIDARLMLLLLVKTAGVVVTVLLLMQSIDQNNSFVKRVCGNSDKKCNAILSSKAAKVIGDLSWSEIGFFYFSGTWLSLLFANNALAIIYVILFLNLAALPYSFFSIIYQARARQWCIFCCTVQGLFWIEFLFFLEYWQLPFTAPNLMQWCVLVTCNLLPIVAWVSLKPHIDKLKHLATLKKQIKLFKFNQAIFDQQLENEAPHSLPDEEYAIVLGNSESDNVLTLVSDPLCAPCANAHRVMHEWLTYRDDMQLRVVFACNNDPTGEKSRLARHMISLNIQYNSEDMMDILHSWYSRKVKNYDEWAKTYPLEDLVPTANKILEKHSLWCKMANIIATPTILINGYELPDNYKLEEIKYLF